MEKLLFAILQNLLPLLQIGDILDAGANDG